MILSGKSGDFLRPWTNLCRGNPQRWPSLVRFDHQLEFSPTWVWLVVWNMNVIFPEILGMSSSQKSRTLIFFRGAGGRLNHQPGESISSMMGYELNMSRHWKKKKLKVCTICEAPVYDSVQLVQINPMSLWFMVVITIVRWGYVHQLITFGGTTLFQPTACRERLHAMRLVA